MHVCMANHCIYHQCCQRRGLPAELGYYEISCRGSQNCWAGSLKLGYFLFLKPWQLSFLQFVSSLSIQSIFEPFQCLRTFYASISGIKTFWRAINIDYPLHTGVSSLIVFLPNWMLFKCFTAEKHPNLRNWAYNYLIKIGLP